MGKNKMGMVLIIILLVALLVLFAVGFVFLYKAMNKANDGTDNKIVVEQMVSVEDIKTFPLGEPIITNLLEGPDKKEHVIKLSVNLGVNASKDNAKDAEKLLTTLDLQRTVIKDIVIGICWNKTYEELKSTDARSVLKDEILLKLKETFETNLIVDVYIDEILFQ
ncbi:flagellar basal body-associated FliL family protein [uncultured Tyzzerella sp.]|uniref:flagellar basal body-associated FliL family protein n=1 Tax=uncultured Tyzzerella sp. TaxID=2321398 RepID=UPI002942C825|nr:flagellar basal body-associated FliL family protein [uncultured Tyzzerella sp.]